MDDLGLDVEMVAASLRADAADLGVFLEVLAGKLSQAVPQAVRVVHQGGLFGAKKVRRIEVLLGEHVLHIERAPGGVQAGRTHYVRGIALKTEAMAVEHWVEELARQLTEHARVNRAAREALGRLVH